LVPHARRLARLWGALKDQAACDFAALVVREAFSRAAIEPSRAGQIVFSNVIPCEAGSVRLARDRHGRLSGMINASKLVDVTNTRGIRFDPR